MVRVASCVHPREGHRLVTPLPANARVNGAEALSLVLCTEQV